MMSMTDYLGPSIHNWDPIMDSKTSVPLLPSASMRLKKDLMSLYRDPPPGIFATADDSNIKDIHALIVGPMDTPYEGGMFYFFLRCPYDFPIKPPKVKFMTTDAGKVRFNPNLYSSGKVCLSIIGTWAGPGWTPAQQISSLLISIQSILNDNPITNEPGFEKFFQKFKTKEAEHYSLMVAHETLRVAVAGMVNNETGLNMPAEFTPIIEKTFLQYYDVYVEVCKKNMHLDGRKYKDPLHPSTTCLFDFKNILKKLNAIHERLEIKMAQEEENKKESLSDVDGELSVDEDDDEEINENNGKKIKLM